MIAQLLDHLEENGYRGRVVPIGHLGDLQEEILARHEQGLIDDELYQLYLSGFVFQPPESLPAARSLIVVAVPHPQFRITFTWQGEPVPAIVPPTYLYAREVNAQVGELLTRHLEPAGYHAVRGMLPVKLLAVRSGLAAYGQNNITYVPGLGSFHRLAAFYSDLPCPEDPWQAAAMMDRCQTCTACQRACPGGAIAADRFQLHAERCITFHNEKPADVPFPAWLDPAWHNCLIGCMHCQRVCPENRAVIGWVEDAASFSEQETALFLRGVPLDQLPAETVDKLRQADLESQYDSMPRNLAALMKAREAQ